MVLRAIKTERTPPPLAARNLAMVHAAIYDAANAVYRTHKPYLTNEPATRATSAEAAVSVAAHFTLSSLYPKQQALFDAALDDSLAAVPVGSGKYDGIVLGQAVAEKLVEWRRCDLSEAKSDYRPSYGLGRWQPTMPDFRPPLLPQLAALRPFAIPNRGKFSLAGPPKLTSAEFVASYQEVKAIGAFNSTTRTREQTEIARFWADGEGTVTPPGHWNRIAQTVAVERRNSLAENARLFAMLNVALADAAICCWEGKYRFDFWRPVTAIRAADRLNNPAMTVDPDWAPLLPTPPFPSYASGHSTFSGAAAAVLQGFFGTDEVRFTSTSDDLPGVVRSFRRFSTAADEAGISRIYGGIHWDFDNRDGLANGQTIGEYVSRSFFQANTPVTGRTATATIAIRGKRLLQE